MDLAPLLDCLADRPLVALTGAGCSTESGIPDYRGPGTARRARNPTQYRTFVSDPVARARYWRRSLVGWTAFSRAKPNPAHQALARLEQQGSLLGIVTQNVDGLHQQAGSREVIELHGSLDRVVCLRCGARERRSSLQHRLRELNPHFDPKLEAELAPDGDAELDDIDGFVVPACLACGGVLKPDLVFFGENVPRPRVEMALELVDRAGALLVVGSSLTVFSGWRFVRRAHLAGIPIAVVNLGPTRGDPLATVRLEARAGEVLPRVARALCPSSRLSPADRRPPA